MSPFHIGLAWLIGIGFVDMFFGKNPTGKINQKLVNSQVTSDDRGPHSRLKIAKYRIIVHSVRNDILPDPSNVTQINIPPWTRTGPLCGLFSGVTLNGLNVIQFTGHTFHNIFLRLKFISVFTTEAVTHTLRADDYLWLFVYVCHSVYYQISDNAIKM